MNAARRRWLLVGAVLFGAAAGFSLSLWSWPEEAATSPVRGVDGGQPDFLSNPAFAPTASATDLRQAAQQAAEELVKAFPRSPDASAILARTQEQPIAEGLAAARQIAVQTHLDAGRLYRQDGQIDKATEMLRKAATLGPENIEPRLELFLLYKASGRHREALEICQQLARVEPDRADHWMNLGLLRAALGDTDGALPALERALALEPENSRYRQAYELIKTGK